jgi:hypothetical protein
MKFLFFNKLGVYLILSLSLFSVEASSNHSSAKENVITFDGYCFQNYDNYTNIKHMVKAAGGKEIPKKFINADPVMRKLGGNAYTVISKKKMYIIGYAENAACSVMTKQFEIDSVIELLNELYSMKLIQKDTNGIQITEMYEIINDPTHNGAILSVVYAKKITEMTVGTISFVPAKTMKKILRK